MYKYQGITILMVLAFLMKRLFKKAHNLFIGKFFSGNHLR